MPLVEKSDTSKEITIMESGLCFLLVQIRQALPHLSYYKKNPEQKILNLFSLK